MAISPDLPGLTLSIRIANRKLPEYQDSDIEDPPRTVSYMIEAIPDTIFSIHAQADAAATFTGSSFALYFYVDGKYVDGALIDRGDVSASSHGRYVRNDMLRRYQFASREKQIELVEKVSTSLSSRRKTSGRSSETPEVSYRGYQSAPSNPPVRESQASSETYHSAPINTTAPTLQEGQPFQYYRSVAAPEPARALPIRTDVPTIEGAEGMLDSSDEESDAGVPFPTSANHGFRFDQEGWHADRDDPIYRSVAPEPEGQPTKVERRGGIQISPRDDVVMGGFVPTLEAPDTPANTPVPIQPMKKSNSLLTNALNRSAKSNPPRYASKALPSATDIDTATPAPAPTPQTDPETATTTGTSFTAPEELGTIKIIVTHVNKKSPVAFGSGASTTAQLSTEAAKEKSGGMLVRFTAPQTVSAVTTWDVGAVSEEDLSVTYLFHYRTREMLEALGVLPGGIRVLEPVEGTLGKGKRKVGEMERVEEEGVKEENGKTAEEGWEIVEDEEDL